MDPEEITGESLWKWKAKLEQIVEWQTHTSLYNNFFSFLGISQPNQGRRAESINSSICLNALQNGFRTTHCRKKCIKTMLFFPFPILLFFVNYSSGFLFCFLTIYLDTLVFVAYQSPVQTNCSLLKLSDFLTTAVVHSICNGLSVSTLRGVLPCGHSFFFVKTK